MIDNDSVLGLWKRPVQPDLSARNESIPEPIATLAEVGVEVVPDVRAIDQDDAQPMTAARPRRSTPGRPAHARGGDGLVEERVEARHNREDTTNLQSYKAWPRVYGLPVTACTSKETGNQTNAGWVGK
jgi:hypothetical protein